jgi:hypothetical protein
MNCYTHPATAAVGVCAVCAKGICRPCVSRSEPRLVCTACAARGAVFGYEYRSPVSIAGWPLIHIASGYDPATLKPRVAKGVIAIGNVALGGMAIAPAAISGLGCDPAAAEFFRRWLSVLPLRCG